MVTIKRISVITPSQPTTKAVDEVVTKVAEAEKPKAKKPRKETKKND